MQNPIFEPEAINTALKMAGVGSPIVILWQETQPKRRAIFEDGLEYDFWSLSKCYGVLAKDHLVKLEGKPAVAMSRFTLERPRWSSSVITEHNFAGPSLANYSLVFTNQKVVWLEGRVDMRVDYSQRPARIIAGETAIRAWIAEDPKIGWDHAFNPETVEKIEAALRSIKDKCGLLVLTPE